MPIIRALLHLYISTVWPHTEGCEYRISLRNLLTSPCRSLAARLSLFCPYRCTDHTALHTVALLPLLALAY